MGEEGKPGLDENGNPTSNTGPGPFPIMDPQLRPLSIYRHTPVFRPQKLTVPSSPLLRRKRKQHSPSQRKVLDRGPRRVERERSDQPVSCDYFISALNNALAIDTSLLSRFNYLA